MLNRVCSNMSGWEAVKCIWNKYSALWLVPAFILGITFGFALGYSIPNNYNLIENMIPEVVGIGISITGIYYLERWRQDKLEETKLKEELLWQAKSRSNETAKSALDRIRYKGWLTNENGLLMDTNLEQANLEGADLSEANLKSVNLKYAQLEDSDLMYADLTHANLSSANLSGAKLMMTKLIECQLDSSNFESVISYEANFNNANLRSAKFKNAVLQRAYFVGSDLKGTSFTDSDLGDASLLGANVIGAKFTDIKWQFIHSYGHVSSATLPDGTKWTENTDIERFTHPSHPEFETTLKKINVVRQKMSLTNLDKPNIVSDEELDDYLYLFSK